MVKLDRRLRSGLVVVLVLLVGLLGLSFAKRPHPGPSADEIMRLDQQTPYDSGAAHPPAD